MQPTYRMRPALLLAAIGLLLPCLTKAHARSAGADSGKLRVYFVDVEGGQSTLFVTPSGTSLLIDTGWPGNEGRDAERILAATKKAGLQKIDYVLLTHYHVDHVGGVPQLAARIPIGAFIDHGPLREMDGGVTEQGYAAYQKILATAHAQHIVARPGDRLPIRGLEVKVISADGDVIANPLPGAGQPNPFCAASETRPDNQDENGRSLGVEVTFGKLTLLDLGDLTWDKEMRLMCPSNKLGQVDVYIVSHHGWYPSSSPALVDAIHARVAVMGNGATKGGSPSTIDTILKAPGLESLWQLHFSEEGGAAHNTPEKYIANPHGPDGGYAVELTGAPDGSFNVTNTRTGFTQAYPAER